MRLGFLFDGFDGSSLPWDALFHGRHLKRSVPTWKGNDGGPANKHPDQNYPDAARQENYNIINEFIIKDTQNKMPQVTASAYTLHYSHLLCASTTSFLTFQVWQITTIMGWMQCFNTINFQCSILCISSKLGPFPNWHLLLQDGGNTLHIPWAKSHWT